MKSKVPAPSAEYLKFLSSYGPQITELSLVVRRLVFGAAPEATELIYDAYNAVAAGYSFTGRPSDAFIHIATYAKWVNLGFNYGAGLPDPARVLQGSGRRVRHIRISEPADLEKSYVRDLVLSAIAAADRPEGASAPRGGKSVVRAIYAKRRRP